MVQITYYYMQKHTTSTMPLNKCAHAQLQQASDTLRTYMFPTCTGLKEIRSSLTLQAGCITLYCLAEALKSSS